MMDSDDEMETSKFVGPRRKVQWNRHVRNLLKKGRTKKAFAVASKMFENGIDPDRDVFDALAKARLMNALGTLLMLAVITTIFIGVPYYLWSS